TDCTGPESDRDGFRQRISVKIANIPRYLDLVFRKIAQRFRRIEAVEGMLPARFPFAVDNVAAVGPHEAQRPVRDGSRIDRGGEADRDLPERLQEIRRVAGEQIAGRQLADSPGEANVFGAVRGKRVEDDRRLVGIGPQMSVEKLPDEFK